MTTQTAADAIDRSISHDEIVTIPYDAEIATDLLVASEDSVEVDDRTEYWGTSASGHAWRVHMLAEGR